MNESEAGDDGLWFAAWLDAIASGAATMSQRNLASIERHGGIAALVEAARARRVHLLRLTDDRGREIVAASLTPFETLC